MHRHSQETGQIHCEQLPWAPSGWFPPQAQCLAHSRFADLLTWVLDVVCDAQEVDHLALSGSREGVSVACPQGALMEAGGWVRTAWQADRPPHPPRELQAPLPVHPTLPGPASGATWALHREDTEM